MTQGRKHRRRNLWATKASPSPRGHGLEWDPEINLESIRVHPDADDSIMETVSATVDHYAPALKNQVEWSEMRTLPKYQKVPRAQVPVQPRVKNVPLVAVFGPVHRKGCREGWGRRRAPDCWNRSREPNQQKHHDCRPPATRRHWGGEPSASV